MSNLDAVQAHDDLEKNQLTLLCNLAHPGTTLEQFKEEACARINDAYAIREAVTAEQRAYAGFLKNLRLGEDSEKNRERYAGSLLVDFGLAPGRVRKFMKWREIRTLAQLFSKRSNDLLLDRSGLGAKSLRFVIAFARQHELNPIPWLEDCPRGKFANKFGKKRDDFS